MKRYNYEDLRTYAGYLQSSFDTYANYKAYGISRKEALDTVITHSLLLLQTAKEILENEEIDD
jgi:hypothetical protein